MVLFPAVAGVRAALQNGHPKALLTDIRLPDADGLNAADWVFIDTETSGLAGGSGGFRGIAADQPSIWDDDYRGDARSIHRWDC